MTLRKLTKVHTVYKLSPVDTPDTSGAIVRTYAVAARLQCRVVPASASQIELYGRNGFVISHVLYFSGTTAPDLSCEDIVRYGAALLEVRTSRRADEGAVRNIPLWMVTAEEIRQRQTDFTNR